MTGGSREIRAAALEATTTRDWAAQVLHHFGQGGYEAGSFRAHLIRAALGADRQNLGRIAAGFPELAAAIELSQDFDDGILRLRRVAGIDPRPGCPDGGTCHHQCPPTATGPRPCFRVRNAGPLSGVYPLNVWPEAVRHEHGAETAHVAERPASPPVRAADSPRWCATCDGYGDHHTDRHPRS